MIPKGRDSNPKDYCLRRAVFGAGTELSLGSFFTTTDSALTLTPAAKLSAGMKTATSLSPDNLGYKVGKISHREIRPAEI